MIPESNQLRPHQWVESHTDYLYAYTIARISEVLPGNPVGLVRDNFLILDKALVRKYQRCQLVFYTC
jgi:hypothetical protein